MRGFERVSKVFIDSRYCLPDGSIETPGGGVQLEPSNRFWLAEFSCVASWHTIDATNNLLYVQEKPSPTSSVLRIISLAHGVYDQDSLAAEIENKINAAGATTIGTFLYVTRQSTSPSGPATGGSTSFKALRIQAAYPDKIFCLPSEALIRQLWIIPASLPTNSTNNLFKFPTGDQGSYSHLSSFVDLRRCHSIFIHTPIVIRPVPKPKARPKRSLRVSYGVEPPGPTRIAGEAVVGRGGVVTRRKNVIPIRAVQSSGEYPRRRGRPKGSGPKQKAKLQELTQIKDMDPGSRTLNEEMKLINAQQL